MAVTPNYSWPVPVNTDLVKDGAEAIKDLGDAIDATVFGLPSGAVVQVLSTTKTDTFSASVTIGAFSAVTGLSASITPSTATNKVLVIAHLHLSTTTNYGVGAFRLKRGATVVGVGDSAGSRKQQTGAGSAQAQSAIDIQNVAISFLDSPETTSATTYSVEFYNYDINTTATIYLNRSQSDPDNNAGFRPISTITLMEVTA